MAMITATTRSIKSRMKHYYFALFGCLLLAVASQCLVIPEPRISNKRGTISPLAVDNSNEEPVETTLHTTDTTDRSQCPPELIPIQRELSRRNFLTTASIAAVTAGSVFVDESKASTPDSSALTSISEAVSSGSAIQNAPAVPIDLEAIFKKAAKKAVGGGKAGAAAAVVQVCSLMWLRTSMNYQYRYGGDLGSSLKTLYKQGGISRLYQGLPFALVQGPATRFGDTAANVGILALLDAFEATQDLPLPLKTACGSVAAGLWRIFLMPIDSSKTAMQVEGAAGLEQLWQLVLSNGPGALYRGAFAQAAATAAGHFPWFVTFNFLNEQLPVVTAQDDLLLSLARSAFLGLAASCVSDCASNSLRVIKTTKQTAQLNTPEGTDPSYPEVVKMIIDEDGIAGLFGRGLQTRLITNCIQGAAFSVLWKYFQQVGGMQG